MRHIRSWMGINIFAQTTVAVLLGPTRKYTRAAAEKKTFLPSLVNERLNSISWSFFFARSSLSTLTQAALDGIKRRTKRANKCDVLKPKETLKSWNFFCPLRRFFPPHEAKLRCWGGGEVKSFVPTHRRPKGIVRRHCDVDLWNSELLIDIKMKYRQALSAVLLEINFNPLNLDSDDDNLRARKCWSINGIISHHCGAFRARLSAEHKVASDIKLM